MTRILIYSHDTYGLGHLRRSMLIADALVQHPTKPSVLIATGSPRAQSFALPTGCDTVKLPSVLKQPDGTYHTRSLGTSIDETMRMRSELLISTARGFQPDVILVDHAPIGLRGELEPLFDEMRTWTKRPRLVLGLRDIIDETDAVRRAWDEAGVWTRLERDYDTIFVYGDRRLLTTAEELELPRRLGAKVQFTGYLGRGAIRGLRSSAERRILVTVGGGGDGAALLDGVTTALEEGRVPPAHVQIVTGPFLSDRRFTNLKRRIETACESGKTSAEILAFTRGLQHHLAEADAVISMAGYNSVMEILSAQVPALLVPRETPRMEQRIRAERLGRACGLAVWRSDTNLGVAIGNFLSDTFAGRRTVQPTVDLGGVDCVVEEVLTPDPLAAIRYAQ